MNPLDEIDQSWPLEAVAARARVIIDNDLSGDPDGLVQLAQHLLSPSVDVVGIIGTRLKPLFAPAGTDTAAAAVERAHEVARLCRRTDVPIVQGLPDGLADRSTGIDGAGVRLIIDEAMREDDRPLYIACGASLTEIASAWLLEPRIAERVIVVWIGGPEYDTAPPPGRPEVEYNLSVDVLAAQVVFNDSNLRLWQFPRNVYRQVLASRAEMRVRMAKHGELGQYLYGSLGRAVQRLAGFGITPGEVFALGDSPLVTATALQTLFQPDPASNLWEERPCPRITDDGVYAPTPGRRSIRVCTLHDNRLMLEDLYAKLELHTFVD